MAEELPRAEQAQTAETFRVHIESYTVGKGGETADPLKNEDVVAYDESGAVLADGSTTKNKELAKRFETAFDGRSGGRVAAETVAHEALASGLQGRDLVDHVSSAVHGLYEDKFPDALEADGSLKPEQSMATTFVALRFNYETGTIDATQVGDTSFRVRYRGGRKQVFTEQRQIDAIDAANRAKAIRERLDAGDTVEEAVPKGRAAIMDSLNGQAANYWNNPDSPYGFGYVTGAHVPDKFVGTYQFNAADVETIEIFSDGYTYAPEDEWPDEPDIDKWEEHIEAVHAADPDKYLRYLSTKPRDDRAKLVVTVESAV
jgi:hypothetical protein